MKEISIRTFGIILVFILILQLCAGLWHIGDPFIDGRYHYNWGPPFWLMHAKAINEVGLNSTYFGLKDYASHPQLIGPVIALWTQIEGYSEFSARLLSLLLAMLSTLFLTFAARSFFGNRRALMFALFFVALPSVYIYGKMLNQEVLLLVFLGIHLWGIGTLEKSKKWGLFLVSLGSFGMMLSDWSGGVFTFATAAGAFIVWRKNKKRQLIELILFSWGATAIGLAIFLIQSYLQAGVHSVYDFIHPYIGLWKYRAGLTDDFTWFGWIKHQFGFIGNNFTLPVFLIGLFGIFWGVKHSFEHTSFSPKTFAVFIASIFLGSYMYMVIVPQASGIHVYYQYYLSLPIAVGLVYFIEFLMSKISEKNKKNVTLTLIISISIILGGISGYEYHELLFVNTKGDISDIKLMQTLRDIPKEKVIIAASEDPLFLFWFQNPNIDYYSDRKIQTYLFDDGVPLTDYQIIQTTMVKDVIAFINSGSGYGNGVRAETIGCSTNLCLLELKTSRK